MPPSAASKAPLRVARAPVKAPRSWPKSSLSTSFSGSAAQLTATNGPFGCRAQPVQIAGDQLLARAALAHDQHRTRDRRDPRDGLSQLRIAALAPTSELSSPSAAQALVTSTEPAPLDRALDFLDHALDRLGLIDEAVGAEPQAWTQRS